MKTTTLWALLFWAMLMQTVFSVAYALDLHPVLPGTDADAAKLAETVWNFIVTKQYGAAVGPALMLSVWGLKKWDLAIFNFIKLPKAGEAVDKFLDRPFVSWLLPTAISAVAAFVTALLSGHSFAAAFGAVWAASSTAIAAYVGIKKFDEQFLAGEKAAAAVDSKAAAVDELKRPPDL